MLAKRAPPPSLLPSHLSSPCTVWSQLGFPRPPPDPKLLKSLSGPLPGCDLVLQYFLGTGHPPKTSLLFSEQTQSCENSATAERFLFGTKKIISLIKSLIVHTIHTLAHIHEQTHIHKHTHIHTSYDIYAHTNTHNTHISTAHIAAHIYVLTSYMQTLCMHLILQLTYMYTYTPFTHHT